MMVGYSLENVLGCVLAISLCVLRERAKSTNSKLTQRWTHVATCGYRCFYDNAMFFTFSIQVASTFVAVRWAMGDSSQIGIRDSTIEINYAISLLTILPLLYIMHLPSVLPEPQAGVNQELKRRALQKTRETTRIYLIYICWFPSFLHFLLRLYNLSRSEDYHTLPNTEWDVLNTMCTGNVQPVTNAETLAVNIFGVTGFIFMSSCIWIKVVLIFAGSRLSNFLRQRRVALSIALFLTVPVFAISQIWTVLRLRRYQQQVLTASGNKDLDDQWTFGQVAATTVFLPVLIEFWLAWYTY